MLKMRVPIEVATIGGTSHSAHNTKTPRPKSSRCFLLGALGWRGLDNFVWYKNKNRPLIETRSDFCFVRDGQMDVLVGLEGKGGH